MGNLPKGTSAELRTNLAKLAGVLRVHLSMEDKSMYPRLFAHPDEKVRAMATDYQRTMGDLAPVFNAYYEKWMVTQAIDQARDEFATATKSIANALSGRIKKENDELYTFIDRIEVDV